MNGKARYVLPSTAQFLFFILSLCMSFSPLSRGMLNDGDTGYHIRAGEYILDTMSVPRHDIFSFHSPPLPWIAHEWLSETIMAWLHRRIGLTGVVIFFIFLISLTYALMYKFIRKNKGNILFDLLIVFLVLLSSQMHWLARPHVFSLLIFVVWYRLLDLYQYDGINYLFLLPAIMLLWVNLHGGFVSGLLLLGIYLSGNILIYFFQGTLKEEIRRKIKPLFFVSVACLLATMVNPYTYRILLFPFKLVSDKTIMDGIIEFLSPNFHEYMPFKYLLLFLIAMLAISRRPLNVIELVLVLLFTSMALYSVRHVLLFAIIVAPVLSRQTKDLTARAEEGSFVCNLRRKSDDLTGIDERARGYHWAIISILIVAGGASMGKVSFRFDETRKPVAAVEFLKGIALKGNVYNSDEFGDYMIYAAYPDYRVFIDGRMDMYGAEKFEEYLKVANFRAGWEKVIEKYGIRWVFFPSDTTLSNALNHMEDWKLVYSDNVASVFLKNIPEYEGIVKKFGDRKDAL